MKFSPETMVNPGGRREVPPQRKITPQEGEGRFDVASTSVESQQERVKELTASLDGLFDSYEKLRGKNDDASLAAKQFIVSQSKILIGELEKVGVNTSGIVTDEMLQPYVGKVAPTATSPEPATPSNPPAQQDVVSIPQKKIVVTPTHEQPSPQLDTHLQSRLNKINNASNFLGSAAKKMWGGYVSIVEKVIPESLTDEAIEARFKRWFRKNEKKSATVKKPTEEAADPQNNSAQTYETPRPTIRGVEQPSETAIKSPDDNKAWLPYKTPIRVDLFDSPIFKKVMLSLPTQENELPISGEQAYKWAMPAIQEMYRLTNTTRTPETMDAIAKLQTYLGVLQSDKEKAEFVVRARTDFLNSQKRVADQNQ